MFVARYDRTMRNARPVADAGIDLRRRFVSEAPTPKKVIFDPVKVIRESQLRDRQNMARAMIEAGRAAAERAGVSSRPIESRPDNTIPMDAILRRISRATGISVFDMRSDRRTRPLVFARQAVMYWAYRRTLLSFEQIGKRLGGRDHSTVLHGVHGYVEKRAYQGRTLRRPA